MKRSDKVRHITTLKTKRTLKGDHCNEQSQVGDIDFIMPSGGIIATLQGLTYNYMQPYQRKDLLFCCK